MSQSRQIFLHGSFGQRHLKEILSAQLLGLILKPELVWIVSPWITNFILLDNCFGEWDVVDSSWSNREVSFVDFLVKISDVGCKINVVTRDDLINNAFINQVLNRVKSDENIKFIMKDLLHTKGIVTSTFFLKGSMNLTFSGVNRNDETLMITNDPVMISEAIVEFSNAYND